MGNKATTILIFSTLVLVAGAIAYSHYKGIKDDVEKNW
jgi:hypothetical protein